MLRFRICSGSVETISRRFTIDWFVTGHFLIGARRRVSTELNEPEGVFGPSSGLQKLI